MKMVLEHPWDGCVGYKIFHKKEGRYMMNIIRPNGSRTTTAFARYLMSVEMGRLLLPNEHVDHIDEIKTNDFIDNLQILSQRDNNIKNIEKTGRKSMMVKLKCPVCEIEFERAPSTVNHKINRGIKPTCSRRCGGIWGRR